MNHLSLVVPDYVKSRDFYVDLFGMRVSWDDGKSCALEFGSVDAPNGMYIRHPNAGEKPMIHHIAFAMDDFMSYKAAMKAELERRGVANLRPDGEVGWTFDDPSGYMLNVVVIKHPAMFPGAASLCLEARSSMCTGAYAVGVKNLAAAPKASGKGFRSLAFSHIVLNVPDVATEVAFYRDLYGMKVIYDSPGESFLRFGQNALYLRKTPNARDKPFVNHFALALDQWDATRVNAELTRRGLMAEANTPLAWTITDPAGFTIDVTGPEMPEYIVANCRKGPRDAGAARSCPQGIDR